MKRISDITLALASLVVLAPMLLILAMMVRLKNGSPVFFTQARPGLQGHPFLMYKFRTMTDDRDVVGNQTFYLQGTNASGMESTDFRG